MANGIFFKILIGSEEPLGIFPFISRLRNRFLAKNQDMGLCVGVRRSNNPENQPISGPRTHYRAHRGRLTPKVRKNKAFKTIKNIFQ